MEVSRISSAAQLTTLTSEWNALSGDIPFRKWEWLGTWWQHYGEEHELYVLTVHDRAGKLVAIAPWYLDCASGLGRTIRFLGTGEICTDHLSILASPMDAATATSAIADWLGHANASGHPLNSWDELELRSLAASDPVLTTLDAELGKRGYTVDRRPGLPCWRVSLPSSWEDYLASLSKPRRRCLRTCRKRLSENGDCVARRVRDTKELKPAWDALVELHQRRRHSMGQPGCFASATFARFLADAVEKFYDRNELDFVVVEHQGRPIGVELNFVGAKSTFVYQSGIEPSALEENPGWLVNAASIEQALRSGHEHFDLLRGDERYKAHLKAEPLEMVDLRIIAPKLVAQVRHGVWRGGIAVKEWIKSGLNMAGLKANRVKSDG